MKANLGYKIDSKLKNEYDCFIEEKYGHKRNRCGLELANWMKMGLALHGYEKYQDDPDIVALLSKFGGSFSTHTHNISKKGNVSENVVVDLVEEIKSLKDEVKQLRSEVKGKPSKKTGSMAEFKKQFKAEYGEFKQVSRRDIVRFVTNTYGVHDSRAIQNRINFLIAHEVLEPYTNNVFNVKM